MIKKFMESQFQNSDITSLSLAAYSDSAAGRVFCLLHAAQDGEAE